MMVFVCAELQLPSAAIAIAVFITAITPLPLRRQKRAAGCVPMAILS